MATSSRKPTYCLRFIVVIVTLVFLIACGLPTFADYCPPPAVRQKTPGSTVTFWLERFIDPSNPSSGFSNIKGFVIYYKVVSPSQATDDQFDSAGVGERVFTSRNYNKAFSSSMQPAFAWSVPSSVVDTQFPLHITLEYATSEPTIKVKIADSYDTPIDMVELYRYDGQKEFTGFARGDTDTGGEAGTVDISLSIMAFNLNLQTANLNPSTGVFLDRIKSVTIN